MAFTGWYVDNDVPDCHAQVDDDGTGQIEVTTSRDTYRSIAWAAALDPVWQFLEAMGPGQWRIPAHLVRTEEQIELERHLELLEPAESETCTLPTCWQPATRAERGFPLCATHGALLTTWDSLLGA